MHHRYTPDPARFELLNTEELRETFLIDRLFQPGKVILIYTDADRAIVGAAVPADGELRLEGGKALASEHFCDRREVGVINIGGDGSVTVDGVQYPMTRLDALYIGRGAKEVLFASVDGANPAKFYLISYPAHAVFPTAHAPLAGAEPVQAGGAREANKRIIHKYIHPAGIKSCQLVMGCTILAEGSVWNTMTPHTHDRRTEVYLYFDLAPDAAVFHYMGEPRETRHILVRNGEAVISPSWSIHAGCGTSNYAFVWAMGGENQDFGDMDGLGVRDLK